MRKYLALLAAMAAVGAMALAGSALAGKGGALRPFAGAGIGTTTATPISTTTVGSSSVGVYEGSHLGNGTYTIAAVQDWSGYPTATNTGTFVFVAANGDRLTGSVGGTTTEIGSDNTTYHSALTVTITGGTGHFAGATGSISISGDSVGPAYGPYADTFAWSGLISK